MRVFVGTSSKENVLLKYKDNIMNLGELLSSYSFDLIMGGSPDGLMGVLYNSFKFHDLKVISVSDIKYIDDVKECEFDDYKIVNTTFERTKTIYEQSDVLIITPGGIGSISELFSMLEEHRTREDKKEIIIYNYNDYYKNIIKILKKGYEEKFISSKDIQKINIVDNINSLKKILDEMVNGG